MNQDSFLNEPFIYSGSRYIVKQFRLLIFEPENSIAWYDLMSFIDRFLRGLISGFPFFIPHALDFIESLREMTPDRYKASLVSQLQ